MNRSPFLLFALDGSRDLAENVANRLEIALAPHEERVFEDGEHKTRPLRDVRGHDVFVLHALYGDDRQSSNDKFCRLLFFCGALRDAGAARVTAVIPYLCYARKDRRTKLNDPITTRYLAAMVEAVGVTQVIAVEVHNISAFENAFRCPTIHIDSAPLFAAHLAAVLRGRRVAAVSPDAGGTKRAELFRQTFEQLTKEDVSSAYVEKFRSEGVVTGKLLAGDVNGTVAVIIDDLISSGGTLVRAAAACRMAGAVEVLTVAAHGLFVGGASELFDSTAIDGIMVTSTVPPFRVLPPVAERRLIILDISEAIARAISASRDGA